jgi:hypothetical protein
MSKTFHSRADVRRRPAGRPGSGQLYLTEIAAAVH